MDLYLLTLPKGGGGAGGGGGDTSGQHSSESESESVWQYVDETLKLPPGTARRAGEGASVLAFIGPGVGGGAGVGGGLADADAKAEAEAEAEVHHAGSIGGRSNQDPWKTQSSMVRFLLSAAARRRRRA